MTHARQQTGLENIKGLINFISLSCSTMYLLCKKKNPIEPDKQYKLLSSNKKYYSTFRTKEENR